MTITAGPTGRTTAPLRAVTVARQQSQSVATLSKGDTKATSASSGQATVVDISDQVKAQLTQLASASDAAASATKSFDESVKERTDKLAATLKAGLAKLGIPPDEKITLQLDSTGQVKTDSPYKKKIEKMFKDDPELAKEFKDVASLNSMRAAQKALDAFEAEKRAAKDDDQRSLAYGRYTARLAKSQELSGTMTLEDGKLTSASLDFMTKAVGEIKPAEASETAKQVAAQRFSRTV